MTTTTATRSEYTQAKRDHAQKRIDRARAKGRKTSHYRARYAADYEAEINRKRSEKAASFASLTALILWALSYDHRRCPLGKPFTTLRGWASHAGYNGNQTIAELKRLHAAGRVEYTGGGHSWDRGLWHAIHEGPKRDLGTVECRLLQVDEHNHEASCEVDGYAVTGYGKSPREAKQALGRRLSLSGLTGKLTK